MDLENVRVVIFNDTLTEMELELKFIVTINYFQRFFAMILNLRAQFFFWKRNKISLEILEQSIDTFKREIPHNFLIKKPQ